MIILKNHISNNNQIKYLFVNKTWKTKLFLKIEKQKNKKTGINKRNDIKKVMTCKMM